MEWKKLYGKFNVGAIESWYVSLIQGIIIKNIWEGFMNLAKSIDFLLENAGPIIQYRLRKEILNNISVADEENLLEQIYQTPQFIANELCYL